MEKEEGEEDGSWQNVDLFILVGETMAPGKDRGIEMTPTPRTYGPRYAHLMLAVEAPLAQSRRTGNPDMS